MFQLFVKLNRLRWTGHVMTIADSDPAKKVLSNKPGGNAGIRRGRTQCRWCDELEGGVAKFGRRNWRINVRSRQKWRKVSEEVQVPPRDVEPMEEEDDMFHLTIYHLQAVTN